MSLKVIGAGFPRTATWSQKLALEMLGFGPCYHMSEALHRPEHWPLWEAAAAGGAVDWGALFAGWGSTTDAPGCHFYREFCAVFPDAKVVLSVRDEEKWFASTQATILSEASVNSHAMRGIQPMIRALGWSGDDPRVHDKAWMLDRYRRHNAEVQATVPPERLLVYRVSEGWGPLCAFLGVPVPNTPFPAVNSTEEFTARMAARVATEG